MKLVKLFNKLSAVALAASLVVGFASCSTTTDDPFNPNAPLTLEEYVKSEIKKAIENGGAQAKPEDPSELEFESRTSLMDKIQLNNEKTEDAWGNGTKISSANPLQASEGYGWDKENGQISLPFAYDAGYFGENTHIIIEADDSALNYNADAAIKIEFKVENPSTKHSNEMNITSKFKDGVAIIPISEIGFTDSCQFLLTFRAKGIVTIKNIDMAKAKGQSAPEPTPGEEETPVKSIELVKNPYAEGGALQTQVKIPSELTSLSVGDKVKVAFSGTADREIGNVELMIVDTTETASWWTALSETKKDTFSTDINFDFEFVITKAPIGTGADSMVLAINGLDSDEAATIKCTSFSIEKNADKKPAGGEDPEPTPEPEPTPDPKPEDSGLLSAEADFPDWGQNTITITSDKFASLEKGDKFTIKCKRSNHVDADYHKIEFMITGQKSVEFALGEEEGEQTLTSGPLFTVQVDSIKANGVTIQGYKATIASVVITKGDGKEPADPGLLTSEFDINTYDANTSVGKENFTGDVVKALKFSYVIGSVNDGTSKLTLWVGDWQSKYKDGECTGGESLHDGNYNLETPTEEIQYFIYTPTEDEWANLKAQGMAIQGYAVKLIKLELVDNN